MSNQGGGSEIQEECRKLQRTADVVDANWSAEILAYEGTTSNKPNRFGVVADETLFPYHDALYPLLDCFDGLQGNRNVTDKTIIPPSPAPLPYRSLNGNRRKKSAPTIDAHGVEIMELAMLENHLPNSAWAIRDAIMPLERQQQFANEHESCKHIDNDQHQQEQHQQLPVRQVNDGQRHPNPRFWNILMDSKSEITRIASSEISLPPIWDDDGFGDDDDSNNWEDIDDSNSDIDATTSPILNDIGNLARNFTFLSWWEQTIIKERRGIASSSSSSQASLPSYLYLKVLMHSLSELQSDHRLARAILLLMADCKTCSIDSSNVGAEEESGLECLRRLLTVLSFGYTPCDGYCHESYIAHENAGDLLDDDCGVDVPNHYCSDWWEMLGAVSTLIGYGIENMTNQHASIICAFFGLERDEDDDPSTTITHVHLLSAILNGIRLHANSARVRLESLSNDADGYTDDINADAAQISRSFHNCVNIFVDIGERILLRLPNNFVNCQLAGLIVRGLLEAYMDSAMMDVTDSVACYLSQNNADSKLRSIVDPLRYANAITNSSAHPLVNSHLSTTNAREQFIGFHPPRDVQDLVKGLFRRDLVDLNIAGCGYGDFLCWLHLPIQPEPLLFDYTSNFPQEDDDEEPPQEYEWVQDEHGFMQNAISSLALCAHRYGVPASIVEIVNSFLPRSWFDDERMCCWSHECQMNQLSQLYREKISSRSSNWNGETSLQHEQRTQRPGRTLTSCGCKVAMVCSKDHWKRLHQEGHKRQCGLPPFRPPFSKEDNLFVREIFEESDVGLVGEVDDEYDRSGTDQNDDDTDSWESIDTNAEDIQKCTMHDKIYSWFNSQSYKIQRREAPAPPFANFY
ncbi:hypothetical protein QTG54_004276 [Skeletonema marinoi]|uniref:Uncharacterized protein n=1 Tax=Skeletonema marinoi TaxID=267567 RepID=A0AAD8YGE9_9STRA|nr:hypothetical protein QTG54_004276 [Skeletonema marinoi]